MMGRIVYIEAMVLGVSALFLTPILVTLAAFGHWIGFARAARVAAWGGVFLFAGVYLLRGLARWT